MKARLVLFIEQIAPEWVFSLARYATRRLPYICEWRRAHRALQNAYPDPEFLPNSEIDRLHAEFPRRTSYPMDEATVRRRGASRAARLLRLHGANRATDYLELAGKDGMVSAALASEGKRATMIDFRDENFSRDAKMAGVSFKAMSAENLEFADESFDFVFSYNAFEHFHSPEAVLREALRVLRPGGHVYLDFNPLYNSPFGLHAYHSTGIPYVHLLFSREQIERLVERNGLRPVNFDNVNRWSLMRYRELWGKYAGVAERVLYDERVDLTYVGVISRYSGRFKDAVRTLDELTVSGIRILLKRLPGDLPAA